jgi:MinD-like ATPase involved in chromosome partitioning or flagellar assembly
MVVPRRSESVVSRKIGDDTVIVPVRAGVANLEAVFTLNAVATTIWNRIDGQATLEELARVVTDEFDVSAASAAADVAEFVGLLSEKGLVVAAR